MLNFFLMYGLFFYLQARIGCGVRDVGIYSCYGENNSCGHLFLLDFCLGPHQINAKTFFFQSESSNFC